MLEDNVNHELTKIDAWMKTNRLSINYNKTQNRIPCYNKS